MFSCRKADMEQRMNLTTSLRQAIDALIAADAPRQVAGADGIISSIHLSPDGVQMRNVRFGELNRIADLLSGLYDQDLATVMALTMHGAENASSPEQATFQELLDDARQQVNDADGRNRTITSLSGKPLSKYLPIGLKRAGLD
jgi:hypothetical protein